MSVELLNFIETVLNGLMSGVMYSLVALGFVLIFDWDCDHSLISWVALSR